MGGLLRDGRAVPQWAVVGFCVNTLRQNDKRVGTTLHFTSTFLCVFGVNAALGCGVEGHQNLPKLGRLGVISVATVAAFMTPNRKPMSAAHRRNSSKTEENAGFNRGEGMKQHEVQCGGEVEEMKEGELG